MANKTVRAAASGLLVGSVNGLFGGGGGMVAVPVLKNGLNYSPKQAHATAILVILPVCAVSAITYICNGFVDLALVIPASIGNVLGGILGAKLLGKLPRLAVQVGFVAVMLAAGLRLVIG